MSAESSHYTSNLSKFLAMSECRPRTVGEVLCLVQRRIRRRSPISAGEGPDGLGRGADGPVPLSPSGPNTRACLEKDSNLQQMTGAFDLAFTIGGGAALVHGVQMRNATKCLHM